MSLIEHLADTGDIPTEPEQREKWRVDGPKKAEWALLKLRKAKLAQNDAHAQAADEIERIKLWEAERERETQEDIDWLEMQLTEYHRGIVEEEIAAGVPDKNLTKSIKLPAGTLKSRMAPDRVVVADENELVAWAMVADENELVKVSYSISKTALKACDVLGEGPNAGQFVTENGQVVPYAFMEPGTRRFDVDVTL